MLDLPAGGRGPKTRLRAARTERLKQAKAEAEKEIKAYRQQREEKYQKSISEVRSLLGSAMPGCYLCSRLC